MQYNGIEGIGSAFVRKLIDMLDFDITEYCNAAVDASYLYCIQEFKKACDEAGIDWQKSWEDILFNEN